MQRFSGWAVALVLWCYATAQAEIQTQAGWDGQLFPSFIIATATIRLPEDAVEDYDDSQVLGDRQGLLGVTVTAPEDGAPIKVTVSCDAILEPSTFAGTLESEGESYTVLPKIRYKYAALAKQHQSGPVTVTFKVQVGDSVEEVSQTMTLRSINDCPFLVVQDDETMDTCFMFAAYVNEQHPFVDKLLREALDTDVVSAFTGYQTKDPQETYRQVYALWHALSERDLRYSDITTSAADSDCVASQHVRMIDESINNAQANCVDGSVLLASLLRKVGIEPMLMMTPGHCYLAFYLDAEGKQLAALETTLLGSTPEEATELADLDELLDDEWTEENSWRTFTAALAIGTGDLKKNAEKFAAGDDNDYQLINIAAARKIGILPIAFQADHAFVAAPSPQASADDDESEEEDEDE